MITKGQKINDRYEVIRSIGEGGMANVYLGHDTILDRNVAIKVLRGDLTLNKLTLPKHFTVEIQYKKFNDAFNASFYPGCKLKDINTVVYESDDYYEVCRALKFIL